MAEPQKPATPEATKPATPPPAKEVKGKNLPPSLKDVKGTPQEQTVRNWNAQAKKGLIYQCKEEGCYFPVNPKRDKNNNPLLAKNATTGETKMVMACSWDPSHAGGDQLHTPFKKDDDIDS